MELAHTPKPPLHPLTHTMKKSFLAALLMAAASFSGAKAQSAAHILPLPQNITQQQGHYSITQRTVVSCHPTLQPQAEWLIDRLGQSTGWDLTLRADAPRKGGISLRIDTVAVTAAEGYRLTVTSKGVDITAHDAAGAFYGLQSFLQLLPAQVMSPMRQKGTAWDVPCTTVIDAPAHPYRGYMLDVGRRYYDLSFLKKCVDWMSTYKLNKLQLHLIDDSGWRLEIKKYPRLTSVGAWAGKDEKRIGGYYTQEDMRELVAYAKVRGVEVIPEIEFPAHIQSAIAAYPWLSCRGKQLEVPTQHFISEDILCIGKDSVMQFLRDVLDETMDIFPSKYINIGGDEAIYKRWEECPRCQALMKREGLSKVGELQGYLTNVVNDYVSKRGRTVVGWEEVMMRGKVNHPLVSMLWHDPADTVKVREAGLQAVVASSEYAYFDFPESNTPGEVYAAVWLPPYGFERTYSLPLDDYHEGGTTLGAQGCMWSDRFIIGPELHEFVPINENRAQQYVEYLTFPRLLALSEVAWTQRAKRSFSGFFQRMAGNLPRLDAMGCNYRVPEPRLKSERQLPDGSWEMTLECPAEGATMRYTTDGTYPTPHSAVCREGEKVHVKQRTDLRAITVVTPTHYSLPLILK